MMRLAHTTMLPHLAPQYRSAILLNTDSGICPIIPINAHILNVFKGTLTRYSWKKALMKKTVIDAVVLL